MELVRVTVAGNKLTAKEVHPLGSYYHHVIRFGVSGLRFILPDKHKEWVAIDKTLRTFLIRKINLKEEGKPLIKKYTVEEFGDMLYRSKEYLALIINKNSIML